MATTKKNEIEAIEKLIQMDGYFADAFKEDADRIIANIKSDFPMLNGTQHAEQAGYQESLKLIEMKKSKDLLNRCMKLEGYSRELQDNIETLTEEKETLITHEKYILRRMAHNPSEPAGKLLECFWSKDEVIKCKLAEGLELDVEERKHLVKLLNSQS